jgi:aconitate hydratase
MLSPPIAPDVARQIQLVKGPNIASLPEFEPYPDALGIPVLLKVGDEILTEGR